MKKPPGSTAKSRSKRAALQVWIEQARPERIGETELIDLCRSLAPVSEGYLKKLLRESGVPLAPMIDGVRQGSLDELESTLSALADEYIHGDTWHRGIVRKLVITAKDHARWAARNPDKREQKDEMVLWMLTWLENPLIFREWVKLRRAV